MTSRRPNIVSITTHDLGRHLASYGARTVRSPSLDDLGRSGVRFTNVFCAAPQCSPARAALATGRYPHSNGVMGLSHRPHRWRLPSNERHLARILADAGYTTVLGGLQHVTSNDEVGALGFGRHLLGTKCAEVTPQVEAWLREQGPESTPFYLEVGFADTHRPWGSNAPEWSRGTDRVRWLPPYQGSDEEMAALQGEILAVDRAVGRIVETLNDRGLGDETWVIFTSDHGLAMPRAKGTLYDPGIEVPLIMRWPRGGLAGGRTVDALLSHVDVVPTICEALDLQVDGLQGVSFWESSRQGTVGPRSEIYAEKTYHTSYDPIRAVRTERWKLIMHFSTYDTADVPNDAKVSPAYMEMHSILAAWHPYIELFDLECDPLEYTNLAYHPDHAERVRELIARLREWMESTGDPLLNGMIPSPAYATALELLRGEADLHEVGR